jgi:DNA-binding transcriptional regulator YdaS (Cro superfamily)
MKTLLNERISQMADAYFTKADIIAISERCGVATGTMKQILKRRKKAAPEQIDTIQSAVLEMHRTHTKWLQELARDLPKKQTHEPPAIQTG